MSKIRFHLAVLLAKLSEKVIRLTGRNASHTPGVIALKLCPNFMDLAPRASLVICVTGTNGKTTVANMLTDALLLDGRKTVSNRYGSNIVPGCTTNLLNSLNLWGKCRVDATVFEVDERASRLILPHIKPDYLVVTNLFRDTMKRNAHPDYIFSVIDACCPDSAKLILNADDLCSSMLRPGNHRVFYGIGPQEGDVTEPYNLIADNTLCPKCGAKLTFRYLRYHHIGNAYCPACGFQSFDADYLATSIDRENKTLTLKGEGQYPLIHDATFNIYNELTLIATLREIGLSNERTREIMGKIHVPDSRLSETKVGSVTVTQALAKGQNSVSVSRAFDMAANTPGRKVIVLAMDDIFDRKKSVEYIGWIYDVEYEQFAREDVVQVVCGGPRCYDQKVRLLLAGVPEEKIFCDPEEVSSVDKIQFQDVDKILILYDCYTYDISCRMKERLVRRLEAANEN